MDHRHIVAVEEANTVPESSSSHLQPSSSTVDLTKHEVNLAGLTDEYWRYIPLVLAALKGEWEPAKKFFDENESAIKAPITCSSETALFIAVGAGEKAVHFVEELVKKMPKEALKLRAKDGNTALHTAAMVGNTRAAVILVENDPALPYMRGALGLLPLHFAARNACKDTLLYLLEVTRESHDHKAKPFSNSNVVWLVNYAINSGFYDVSLKLLQKYPQAAKSKAADGDFPLGWIATKASAFYSGSQLNFWQRILYRYLPVKLETNPIKDPSSGDPENPANGSEGFQQKHNRSIWAQRLKEYSNYGSQKLKSMLWKVFSLVPFIKHIREQKQMHQEALALLKFICEEMASLNDSDRGRSFAYGAAYEAANTASSLGIHEVVEKIAVLFPYIIWRRDDNNYTIFQRAVIDRHEKVFNLIYQLGDNKQNAAFVKDNDGNTMLHLAARLAPQRKRNLISGAALQMQHELQWFKAVEKLVRSRYIDWRNDEGATPAMIFTKEHEYLVVEGQKWMENTASSCTITAALIVTIAFAAAITVPGGNKDTGLPILTKEIPFITFAVSNAISLFTSTTSLLMFLSILTSRYAESDFLYVLPKRLIIGLFTLFLSITTMIIAFSATLYLAFGHHKEWILIPLALLACLPITSFVSLQFPLLVDLISSTYSPGIFCQQSDELIC